jgi:hypothetical protein
LLKDLAGFVVAGIFMPARIIIQGGPVPPCGALMRPLPLWCSATGKAGPFLIPACNNLNNSVMHYTEENQVERVKDALFKAWERLNEIYGSNIETIEEIEKAIYKTNYKVIQLLCVANDSLFTDKELSWPMSDLNSLFFSFR